MATAPAPTRAPSKVALRLGGREPILALERFSSRAVRHSISLTWASNALVLFTLLVDAYMPGNTRGVSVGVAWFVWSWTTVVVSAVLTAWTFEATRVQTCCSVVASFVCFRRDWTRLETAVVDWLLVTTTFIVIAFTGTCVCATLALDSGSAWGGFIELASLAIYLPTMLLIIIFNAAMRQEQGQRLNFCSFYLPRLLLVLSFAVVALVEIASCAAPSLGSRFTTDDNDAVLPLRASSPRCQALSWAQSAVGAVIFVVAAFEFLLSKWALSAEDFMSTRFRQLMIRYGLFQVGVPLAVGALITVCVFLSGVTDQWLRLAYPGSLVLLWPMLITMAASNFVIGFLPPHTRRLLCYALHDASPFVVQWADVPLCNAACWDAYYDKQPCRSSLGTSHTTISTNDAEKKDQGYNALAWTRPGYRVLQTLHAEMDVHAMLAELTVAGGHDWKARGWAGRAGDIVVAFRGTATWANIKTDLSFTRSPLPLSILLSAEADPVVGDANSSSHITVRSRAASVGGSPLRSPETQPARETVRSTLRGGRRDTRPVQSASATDAGTTARFAINVDTKQFLNNEMTNSPIGLVPRAARWLLHEQVHRGFLAAYMSIRPRLVAALDELILATRPRHRSLFVTGHSMGGALATLCALDMRTRYDRALRMLRCVTLASPRVGDYRFSRLFDRLVPHALRLVVARDVVPGLPKFFCLFKHTGHEVTVDARGHVVVDPSPIEKAFVQGARTSYRTHSLESYDAALRAVVERHLPGADTSVWSIHESKQAGGEIEIDVKRVQPRSAEREKQGMNQQFVGASGDNEDTLERGTSGLSRELKHMPRENLIARSF